MEKSRSVYRHAELRRLLSPKSLAIVGASENPNSYGYKTRAHMSRYGGQTYLVNPRYKELSGQVCYESISDLPTAPDLVIFTIPRDNVEPILLECADKGVGGAIIFASNYAETALDEGVAMQKRLLDISRASGIRIIGPNCMGFMNLTKSLIASFVGAEIPEINVTDAAIGLVSQSGSMGFSLAQAMHVGTSFSHVITSGNSVDVNVADGIAYLAEEPSCKAIACVLEGVSNIDQLREAGEIAWRADKPLVIFKLGTGKQGAAAAMSHTASLAGSFEGYKALFERTGMVLVEDFKSLIETASFFAKAPRPTTDNLAVVSGSGGMAITHADIAEIHGVNLPQPPEETKKKLMQFIPSFGAPRNPIDATAMAGQNEAHVSCMDTMLADDIYAAGVFPQPLLQLTSPNRLKLMGDVSRKHDKPVCIVWMNGWLGGPSMADLERNPDLCLFQNVDRCMATIRAWFDREKKRRLEEVEGARHVRQVPAEIKASSLEAISSYGTKILSESQSKTLLAGYGVPVVQDKLAQSQDEAVDAARKIGFPVAIKIDSPDIPHKTEIGVVKLSVNSEDELRSAYDEVFANQKKNAADAKINGLLVQPMLKVGAEIMVGVNVDPLFGPLLVVGLGGIFVELMKDTAVQQAPVTDAEAERMLESLKGQAIFKGFRGSEPVDMKKLSEIVARISAFAADHQDLIQTMDINPIICSGDRIYAADALIVKA